jgi:hypothetical protein
MYQCVGALKMQSLRAPEFYGAFCTVRMGPDVLLVQNIIPDHIFAVKVRRILLQPPPPISTSDDYVE